MVLQALDQGIRRGTRGAVGAQLVPEARGIKAALRLVEGVRIGLEGLDLLHQRGGVPGKTVVGDRDRRLAEMVAVLDELREERRLRVIVVERRRRRVQRRKRCRIEDRLHARVALRDVDDVAMDVVDRTPDKLPEVGSERQRACRRVRILDGGDLFIELVDNDLGVKSAEVVDLRDRRAQHLLHADQVGDDQVDLVRANAADFAGGCIVIQIRCCQGHYLFPPTLSPWG